MTNGLPSSTLDSDPRPEIGSTTGFLADTSLIFGQDDFTTEADYDLNTIVPQELNCTPPAIDDFPRDLFTPAQRLQGYLAVHFLASIYIFYCLALVCDEYFVPCIECICDGMYIYFIFCIQICDIFTLKRFSVLKSKEKLGNYSFLFYSIVYVLTLAHYENCNGRNIINLHHCITVF